MRDPDYRALLNGLKAHFVSLASINSSCGLFEWFQQFSLTITLLHELLLKIMSDFPKPKIFNDFFKWPFCNRNNLSIKHAAHGSAEEGYYPNELILGYEVCQRKEQL